MIVFLKEDLEISDDNRQAVFVLRKGTKLTPIRYKYIPRDSTIHGLSSLDSEKDIDEKYFIIYFKRVYLAIPRDKFEVPLTDGWYFNL